MDLGKLNDKQREAVMETDGPILVLAGAGSGKTRVLTTKVAYLVLEKDVLPRKLFWPITFTNKAAKEMKERVHKMLGSDSYRIQILNFPFFWAFTCKGKL